MRERSGDTKMMQESPDLSLRPVQKKNGVKVCVYETRYDQLLCLVIYTTTEAITYGNGLETEVGYS